MGFYWRKRLFPLFFLSLFSLVFTGLTFILGAPLLRAFHRLYGWRAFFGFYALATFLLLWLYPLWGLPFLILWWASSLFFFLYQPQKVEFFVRATLLSTSICFLFLFLLLGILNHWNIEWMIYDVQVCVQALLERVDTSNPPLQGLDAQRIALQFPFFFFLMIFMMLFLSIYLEYPLHIMLGSPSQVINSAKRQFFDLRRYKLPDLCIWMTLSVFLLTFFLKKSPILGPLFTNIAGIFATLYFFQGLAILECFFTGFLGLKGLWKGLFYIVFFMYMNFLVVLIGFADYWFDFRLRMKKKTVGNKK